VEQSNDRTQAILSWLRSPTLDLRVEQDDLYRYLILNGQQQSRMHRQQPAVPVYPHLQILLEWLTTKPWNRLLQLGLGGGDLSRAVAARWPERQVVTVEQESLVIDTFLQYFQPEPHPNQTIICAEAMAYTNIAIAQQQQFDLIVVDIYPWPEHWQRLIQQLLQLRSGPGWFGMNLPGDPPMHWSQFWQSMPVTLTPYRVPGYRNQLWLGQ